MKLLDATDARLRAQVGSWLTLDPARANASSLAQLFGAFAPQLPEGARPVLAEGLVGMAEGIVEHFPDNVLWDLDALVAALVRRAPDAASLAAAFAQVNALNALFGRHTAIRFRYVHDFTYGFDWAKWVRRDPARVGIGPYSARFFDALLTRGQELLDLIDADDRKYPRLRDERARNPFGFSREPLDELRLHRALAADGLVPVEAWRADAKPVWDRPFADLRAAHAAASP